MGENFDNHADTAPVVSGYQQREYLESIICILSGLGLEFQSEIDRLNKLKTRLDEGRFHLAVLGQFKRGKSTFLNALLGEPLLPTAVLPLTTIPTFILAGTSKLARVYFQEDNKDYTQFASDNPQELCAFLLRYVTEAQNPKNRLGVEKVEVLHPAEILKNGVVLIDTPGIGSTLQHNTEATLNFLPQCDAALFLVSADPPLTQTEVVFLAEVKTKIPHLIFVLNKIDYLSKDDRESISAFLKTTLTEQAGIQESVPIFAVSAKNGLAAKADRDAVRWHESGMNAVIGYLTNFLAVDKAKVLEDAVQLKCSNIIANVLMQINLMRRSLELPISDLQTRIGLFEKKINEAQQERLIVSDILAGDQGRVMDQLEMELAKLEKKAMAYLSSVLTEHTIQAGHDFNETDAQEALAEAVPGFFEREIGEFTRNFAKRVTDVLKTRQQKLIEIAESIRKAAAELFEIPYHALQAEEFFAQIRQPVWMKYNWDSSLLPFRPAWFDFVLPVKYRKGRIEKRIRRQIEHLAAYNTGRIRGAMRDNIEKAVRTFRKEFERQFGEIIIATKGAFQTALIKKKEQTESVGDDIKRMEKAALELTQIGSRLRRGGGP
jgi:ribosome biogenesis GTPase A